MTRSPFNVECGKCSHVWIAAWLPMEMGKCAKLLSGAHCPNCGTDSRSIFASSGPEDRSHESHDASGLREVPPDEPRGSDGNKPGGGGGGLRRGGA